MEPGGTEGHTSYESWVRCGGTELIDCREHHLDSGFERWHGNGPKRPTQPTWRRLIQLLLAFKEERTDLDSVYEYQKNRFGATDGETAVLELGALHAPSLAAEVDRETFRSERTSLLHQRIVERDPVFVVCYGYTFKRQFESVIGSTFDARSFAKRNATLCVLVPGPTSFLRGKPTPWAKPEWWIAKGNEMRQMRHPVKRGI